tara:strand:+ start:234 stop:572 length:339 start_codon:yes stop_codon:yes gene_type:complete
MDKCTKIVIGYILAIVLCTVLILSILSKNVRVQLSKNVREDFRTDVVEQVLYAFPLIVVGGFLAFALVVLLITFLIALLEGLFSLGSRAPDQLRSVGTRMRWQTPRRSYASN